MARFCTYCGNPVEGRRTVLQELRQTAAKEACPAGNTGSPETGGHDAHIP